MRSGCLVNDGKHAVNYRGIEDPFSGLWQFIDGVNIKDYEVYVCYDPSKYKIQTYDSNYKKLNYKLSETGGYIKNLGYDKDNSLFNLCTEIGGNTSNYIGDYYWISSGERIAFVGGRWSNGSDCGFWAWDLADAPGFSHVTRGARLLKSPT